MAILRVEWTVTEGYAAEFEVEDGFPLDDHDQVRRLLAAEMLPTGGHVTIEQSTFATDAT